MRLRKIKTELARAGAREIKRAQPDLDTERDTLGEGKEKREKEEREEANQNRGRLEEKGWNLDTA